MINRGFAACKTIKIGTQTFSFFLSPMYRFADEELTTLERKQFFYYYRNTNSFFIRIWRFGFWYLNEKCLP